MALPIPKTAHPWKLLSIFFALALAIALIGFFFYQGQKNRFKKEKQHELLAIANLKVDQLIQWRRERIITAGVRAVNPINIARITNWLQTPGSPDQTRVLLEWLNLIKKSYDYQEVYLMDPTGKILLSTVSGNQPDHSVQSFSLQEAISTRKAVMSDLFKNPVSQNFSIDIFAPVFPGFPKEAGPIGILLFRLDPQKFLYPLIQTWPIPSNTAETLLVRKEGDNVLFLNELRHQKKTALSLFRPINSPTMPAAMAARGIEGIVEGRDYRGEPVLASLRKIPGSSWAMVAKVDLEEIYAPLRRQTWQVALLILVLIAATGIGLGFIWRNQQTRAFLNELAIRKEAEESLRESEERHRSFFEQSIDAVLLTSPDGRIYSANPEACRLFGRSEEEIRRIGREGLIDGSDPRLAPALEERARTGRFKGELNFIGKDGNTFPAEVSSVVFKDREGCDRTIMIIRDVTERMNAKKNLQQKIVDLSILYEGTRLFLGLEDEETILKECCRLVVNNFQMRLAWIGMITDDDVWVYPKASAGIAIGYLDEVRISWDESATGQGPTGRAIRSKQPVTLTHINSDPFYTPWREKARQYGFQSSLAVPLLAGDEVLGTLNLYSPEAIAFPEDRIPVFQALADQTALAVQRARLLSQLKEYSKDLDLKVLGRTKELSERIQETERLNKAMINLMEDLQAARKLSEDNARRLESANKELEAFSYSVSHDLRAPLRAISGFAQIVARRHKDDLNEEGRHYVDNIVEAGERMGRLIDELLTYSRIGRKSIRLQPVSLPQVGRQIASDLSNQLKESGALLRYSLEDDLPEIPSDPTLLGQILSNLIMNGLIYRRPDAPGGPTITVTCEADGKEILIKVADNGIGIPPEYHEKIFTMFQRLHSEEEYPGTGIGLAIVRKSAGLLGGRVWVESEVGVGSTFFVKLPG